MKKLFSFLLALLFALVLPLSTLAALEAPAWFSDDEALRQHVFSLSFEELADEINKYDFSIYDYAMIFYAAGLLETSEKISDACFEEMILSDKNSTALRFALVEIAVDQDRALNAEKLAALIRDEKTDEDLKSKIAEYLVLSDHTELKLITDFIEEEGEYAALFLRLLAIKNRKAAAPYIEKVISEYTGGKITQLLFIALTYKAVELTDSTPKAQAAFLEKCDALIKNLPPEDSESREKVLYALVNMRCAQTAEYLLWPDSAVFNGFSVEEAAFLRGAAYDMKEYVYESYDTSADKAAFAQRLASIGCPLLGDADGDHKVTSSDARLVLRGTVGLEKAFLPVDIGEDGRVTSVDMDADEKITAADARLILRTAVGLETETFLLLPREN